jgi:hypothetical protein
MGVQEVPIETELSGRQGKRHHLDRGRKGAGRLAARPGAWQKSSFGLLSLLCGDRLNRLIAPSHQEAYGP